MADSVATSSDAETAWRAVLARDPLDPAALAGLGRLMLQRRRRSEAIALLSAAAEDGADAALLTDLGLALVDVGRPEEAETRFRQALAGQPDHLQALLGLGRLLLSIGKSEEALRHLRHALGAASDQSGTTHALAEALIAQGNIAYAAGDMIQAEQLYREAIGFNATLAGVRGNLGNALSGQLRLPEALAAYRSALALEPDSSGVGFAYGLCLLLSGDDEQGWHYFERRRQVEPLRRDHERRPDLPQWQPGTSLAGRRVLLTAEQGTGDLIQYARFAPVLSKTAASVVLEVPWTLVGICRTLPAVDRVIDLDDQAHGCDIACPLLSLPLLLGPDNGIQVPYIVPPPDRLPRWNAWLARSGPGRRIGLVCAGDPRHPRDQARSIGLAALSALLDVPDATFVLVQTEIRDTDRAAFEAADGLRCPGAALTDYADTAALLAGLDLLISVDTSAAHLAGAIGLPVWTLLTYAPDYRWRLGRDDSPWYPSMRLYRQERAGDWGSVIERVRRDLAAGVS